MTGIVCPVCKSPHSSVLSTRKGAYRRRECECSYRFTTVEVVIKGTGSGLKIPKMELAMQRAATAKASIHFSTV